MKILVFERTVGASSERVGVKLYKVTTGFIAERFLVQDDQTLLTQVLPVAARNDFDEFAKSDPYYTVMRPIYMEIAKLVWGSESNEEI